MSPHDSISLAAMGADARRGQSAQGHRHREGRKADRTSAQSAWTPEDACPSHASFCQHHAFRGIDP